MRKYSNNGQNTSWEQLLPQNKLIAVLVSISLLLTQFETTYSRFASYIS